MARTTKREIGWPDAEGNEYRVTLACTPGSRGSRDEAPCGPEFEVVSVREDRPGGIERPDLIDTVSAELDGPLGDRAAEEAAEAALDDYYAEADRRMDAERDSAGGRW